MNALFLGYGRMGGALGNAWLAKGLLQSIDAIDPFATTTNPHVHLFPSAEAAAPKEYDLLVIAVKPSMLAQAAAAAHAAQLRAKVVISVMAGVTSHTLSAAFPNTPIVRTMPNTAVVVNAGCTGLYAGSTVSATLQSTIQTLFSAVGTAHWVNDEAQLHIITALSGSGPAYYHLFSETLAAAGQQLGLDTLLAQQLAAQTCLGAATLQVAAPDTFVQLREAVTSPNGTTHAAIQVFETHHALRTLVDTAVNAAASRSRELSD